MTRKTIITSGAAVMLAGVGTFLYLTKDVDKPKPVQPARKEVMIPPMIRGSTNLAVQKSIQSIQAQAMLVAQPYTNRQPTNMVCEIYPFVNWRTNNKVWYLITLDTNLNVPSDWRTEPWVAWSTQRTVSLPISKALGAYFYKAYAITNRAFRFGSGKSNPPD